MLKTVGTRGISQPRVSGPGAGSRVTRWRQRPQVGGEQQMETCARGPTSPQKSEPQPLPRALRSLKLDVI